MSWSRLLPVVALLVITVFWFGPTQPMSPLPQAASAVGAGVGLPLQTEPGGAVKEILPLTDDFFGKLEGKDASSALQLLFSIFPINEAAQGNFRSDIQLLSDRLGYPGAHEFIGFRQLGASERFFLLYFLSHHDKMPVAWEFTFYRPKTSNKWQVNYLRYNSDEIFEFFAYPKIHFESFLKGTPDGVNSPDGVR